jgi:hypothetical protein
MASPLGVLQGLAAATTEVTEASMVGPLGVLSVLPVAATT